MKFKETSTVFMICKNQLIFFTLWSNFRLPICNSHCVTDFENLEARLNVYLKLNDKSLNYLQ